MIEVGGPEMLRYGPGSDWGRNGGTLEHRLHSLETKIGNNK